MPIAVAKSGKQVAIYIRVGSNQQLDEPFANASKNLARIDNQRADDPNVNPCFIAFLNAHNRRVPVPFVAYPFTEWMDIMYRRFFHLHNYVGPDAGRGTLCYNINVNLAQERDGFNEWILEESKKDDCPRCQELMSAHVVGYLIKYKGVGGKKHVKCPTCGEDWLTGRKGGGMVQQAASRHVKACGKRYLIANGVAVEE